MDEEVASTGGTEIVKQMIVDDGGLVKSRDNCPLLSTRVTRRIVFLHIYG